MVPPHAPAKTGSPGGDSALTRPGTGSPGGGSAPTPGTSAGADIIKKEFNKSAASIAMTTMYAARIARFDLLRCVGHSASYITKWDDEQEAKLTRMISYINCSAQYRQVGFIGDPPEDLYLGLYTDADFAGDRRDSKSTSGVYIVIRGPHYFFPLGAVSKKQTVCAHSTPEAEIVAAYTSVRTEGVPALDLWETILGRCPDLYLFEDNQATCRIISTGKFPTLRHVKRMHGVSVSWLHDAYNTGVFKLFDCVTDVEAADIFTKHFVNADKWRHALDLIGVVHDSSLLAILNKSRVTQHISKPTLRVPACAARPHLAIMAPGATSPSTASAGPPGGGTTRRWAQVRNVWQPANAPGMNAENTITGAAGSPGGGTPCTDRWESFVKDGCKRLMSFDTPESSLAMDPSPVVFKDTMASVSGTTGWSFVDAAVLHGLTDM